METRLVIYTCITGAYELLWDPSAVCPDVDYVCFTDTPFESEVWEVRPLGHAEASDLLTTRWYKLNPHLVFPDRQYSLWIDANVIPSGQQLYDIVNDLMSKGSKWAGIRHPQRDDVYDESYRILANGREKFGKLAKTCRFLKSEGFPRHFGLMECNVILRSHNDADVIAADELWWKMFTSYCYRDQMSQTYCVWKTGLAMDDILPQGMSSRNHPAFEYVVHGNQYIKDKSLKGRLKDARIGLQRLAYRLFLIANGTPYNK